MEVGIFMAKYSFQLKKLCVKAYQKGEGSYTDVAKKYGIKDKKQVINWVHLFFATPKYLKLQNAFPKVAAGNSSFLHVSPA